MNKKKIIELKKVSKNFEKNNVKILKNINYSFYTNKIYSVVGPSGSGKSTLLNLISLIDRPSSGQIYLNEKKINSNKIQENDVIRASNISIIYQDNNLLNDFTALENVMLTRLANNTDETIALKDAKKILKTLKLDKRANHYPSELSGGEMQRIAIARAIINSPNIILADEPTGSLDFKNSKEVIKLLFKLKNRNRVVIFATHNTHFAKMADCKLQISDGKVNTYNAKKSFK